MNGLADPTLTGVIVVLGLGLVRVVERVIDKRNGNSKATFTEADRDRLKRVDTRQDKLISISERGAHFLEQIATDIRHIRDS